MKLMLAAVAPTECFTILTTPGVVGVGVGFGVEIGVAVGDGVGDGVTSATGVEGVDGVDGVEGVEGISALGEAEGLGFEPAFGSTNGGPAEIVHCPVESTTSTPSEPQ